MLDQKNGTAIVPKATEKNGKENLPAVTNSTNKLINSDALAPLDERLHRLNQLFEIQNKYNRLKASLLKLQSFKFKKEGDYSGITIKDESRNDFTTGNPEICAEVVKFMLATVERKIKELEPQLKW